VNIDAQQALYALVVALPSFLIGFLAYKRSVKVDAVAAQSGLSADSRAGAAQVIEGLNQLIDNLQEDNKEFREGIRYCTARFEAVALERDELRQRLAHLYRKYGDSPDPATLNP
jgi:hypothetical protein